MHVLSQSYHGLGLSGPAELGPGTDRFRDLPVRLTAGAWLASL